MAEWARLPVVRRVDLAPLAPAEIRELLSVAPGDGVRCRRSPRSWPGPRGMPSSPKSCWRPPSRAAASGPSRPNWPNWCWSGSISSPTRPAMSSGSPRSPVARVPHALLATVVGLPDGELDRALREAVDAHILEPVGASGYQFRHALLGEAAYDDLLPGERIRLHAAYAAALQKDETLGPAAELARHARESNDLRHRLPRLPAGRCRGVGARRAPGGDALLRGGVPALRRCRRAGRLRADGRGHRRGDQRRRPPVPGGEPGPRGTSISLPAAASDHRSGAHARRRWLGPN